MYPIYLRYYPFSLQFGIMKPSKWITKTRKRPLYIEDT